MKENKITLFINQIAKFLTLLIYI